MIEHDYIVVIKGLMSATITRWVVTFKECSLCIKWTKKGQDLP